MCESGGEARDEVQLTHQQLCLEEVSQAVTCPSCGAISIFIGTTRDSFEGKKVVQLEYEAYAPMAQSEIRKICKEIRTRWPTVRHICVYHRLGVVPVTEASVIIGISSPHRRDSLEAVQFCIDTLKASVPIWKKEVYQGDEPCWKENQECPWTGSRAAS
ncbi:molybdopterin synthase catalytic subunit [Osmerus mordax]|uniref:molybdopterin synthase catalytic subunit n=1 Tax=Osmerus mordax TaxID=8014 RepID=UPI00351091E2